MQSFNELYDIIKTINEPTLKRKLTIINGKLSIYLRYHSHNQIQTPNQNQTPNQIQIQNENENDIPIYGQVLVNNNEQEVNLENRSDEEEEVVRKEVRTEVRNELVNNIKNSPQLINIESNLNNRYVNGFFFTPIYYRFQQYCFWSSCCTSGCFSDCLGNTFHENHKPCTGQVPAGTSA